jgi:hypothetical protein
MNAPQLPNFDKKSFPDVPWLPKFYELLRPFLEGVAAALRDASSFTMVAQDVSATVTPATAGALATPVFIATDISPALLMVRVEAADANGRGTGTFLTSSATWTRVSQGGAQGIRLSRLHTVNTLGGTNFQARLTVWVLPG